jgi:hypothetical protein
LPSNLANELEKQLLRFVGNKMRQHVDHLTPDRVTGKNQNLGAEICRYVLTGRGYLLGIKTTFLNK